MNSCRGAGSRKVLGSSLAPANDLHHPVKAVAEAGGWQDLKTLQVCYQHPDRDALLEVMSEPRKLRDAAGGHDYSLAGFFSVFDSPAELAGHYLA